MTMHGKYYDEEKSRQQKLLTGQSFVFEGVENNGTVTFYNEKTKNTFSRTFPFCIEDSQRVVNLYSSIREECIDYFKKEEIAFHQAGYSDKKSFEVPNHILESQIACLNHLFAIRHDPRIVKALAEAIMQNTCDSVYEVKCEHKTQPAYIAFEVVSGEDHLNELHGKTKIPMRGSMCTSIDALIIAEKDGRKILIPIEWKYTESYHEHKDYSAEMTGRYWKGLTRLNSYTPLLKTSKYVNGKIIGPHPEQPYQNTIFFIEPFYQLMRQTLWVEQMIKHKDSEWVDADDYCHIHVIPSGNQDLLIHQYPYTQYDTLESAWRHALTLAGNERYKIIDPKDIVKVISQFDNNENKKLVEYLSTRY